MAGVTRIGRVMVPVADQDHAIEWYAKTLGFTVAADTPFGDGERWVEVAPPAGGTTLALVPPRGEFQPGRMTGLAIESRDPAVDYDELKAAGVDVDELFRGDGTVPTLFFFRDLDGNHLMMVEAQD